MDLALIGVAGLEWDMVMETIMDTPIIGGAIITITGTHTMMLRIIPAEEILIPIITQHEGMLRKIAEALIQEA